MSDTAIDGPLVDCHAHVWTRDMPLSRAAWKRPVGEYPVERYLSDLDANGVRHGVIAAASLFGTYNDYSIRAVRRHPRLRATVIVEPDVDFHTLEAMRADGVVGIRLQWFFRSPLPDVGAEDYQRLLRRLRDLGMHVHLNIEGSRLVELAARLLDTGVNVLIDHYGWHDPAPRLAAPSYVGMLQLLERPNAWVKITSGFRHPDEHDPDWTLPMEYTRDLLARFGPEKLLWGSDAPFVGHEHVAGYATAIERFHRCVPDATTRRAIDANAWRFYFSPGAA